MLEDVFKTVRDFIMSFAYPIAFLGALFYGIASLVSFDPSTVIANKNVSVFINVLIGLAGFVSIFVWMGKGSEMPASEILLPSDGKVKQTVNA